MTYERFEDLPVWRCAAELYDQIDGFLDTAPPRLRPSFRDQLERAALSVSNNIAEGFERGARLTNSANAPRLFKKNSSADSRLLTHCEKTPRNAASSEIPNPKS